VEQYALMVRMKKRIIWVDMYQSAQTIIITWGELMQVMRAVIIAQLV
jgi:hypothetical protein